MTQSSHRRVIVITGASSGIGKATAEVFALMGWHVIGTGRTPERCDAAEEEIRAIASPEARVDFLRGDFTEMSDVRRIAKEIARLTDCIHVLVNNAGGVRDGYYRTSEGLEATFATNHLAPFLLTRELLPQLEYAAKDSPVGTVRIIAVAADGHASCQAMNWDDLMLLEGFATTEAYSQAKLASLLFTRELDRRLSPMGIVAQAVNPGCVGSNFASHGDELIQDAMARSPCTPPEHPARTIMWLATSPEVGEQGGRYFRDLAEIQPAPQARDDRAASRLWMESERILETIGC
ncbi:SDR family NAD(P)-dependent oxidoreductase [Novosphingobium pentaromativorans]|uniref:SDR family NAD(P)-dependent oxidoreductase n=1 Tax=Novosphingobium pentaromativorans TaxID=205844 RepID=UPI00030FC5A6|nr:SDR family NAD(P)-dependent oxidoreductase [Novosphingobium pentaromativorans]AIT78822.1 short-chain dehydrogenase [Novosphingobium pentaromativorans US6-1]